MQNEHSHRLREVIENALELPEERRETYVRDMLVDMPDILPRALSLVRLQLHTDRFLDSVRTPALTRTLFNAALGNIVGRNIGSYHVTEFIACGGMGTVYGARLVDDPDGPEYAIKLLNFGLDAPEFLARFDHERHLLGALQHPCIATLVDTGTTDDGRPYIVMTRVRGVPIDEYCYDNLIPLRDRLRLIQRLCDGVHHAHQRLIVHRDLKPENIMVDADGNLVIVDFGISRLLEDSPGLGHHGSRTTSLRALTPMYASPEHIRGAGVTTSSDVYSIGVILYELLTDRAPYDISHLSRFDQERIVFECEPAKPSVSARQEGNNARAREIDDELDTIALCAMSKDPARRYPSAEHLASDIDRYLRGLPIFAKRDTPVYRAKKFVNRNRVGVGVAILLLTVVLSALIVSTTAAAHARRAELETRLQHQTAMSARAHAEEVAEFLQSVLSTSEPYSIGGVPTLPDLLYESKLRLVHHPPDNELVEADIRYAIAMAYARMWRWRECTEQVRFAARLYENGRGALHPSTVSSHHLLGLSLGMAGQDEGVGVLERLHDRLVKSGTTDEIVEAETTGLLALAMFMSPEAYPTLIIENAFRESMAVLQHSEDGLTLQFGVICYAYASFQTSHGSFNDALALFDISIGVYESCADTPHYYISESLAGAAVASALSGDADYAAHLISRSAHNAPNEPLASPSISQRWSLAWLLHLHWHSSFADLAYHDALRFHIRYLRNSVPGVADRADDILERLPRSLSDLMDPTIYVDCIDFLFDAEPGGGSAPWLSVFFMLISEYACPDDAAALMEHLQSKMIPVYGSDHWRVHLLESFRGDALTRSGRYAEAEVLLLNALDKLSKGRNEHATLLIRVRARLHVLYQRWDKSIRASAFPEQADGAPRLTI